MKRNQRHLNVLVRCSVRTIGEPPCTTTDYRIELHYRALPDDVRTKSKASNISLLIWFAETISTPNLANRAKYKGLHLEKLPSDVKENKFYAINCFLLFI